MKTSGYEEFKEMLMEWPNIVASNNAKEACWQHTENTVFLSYLLSLHYSFVFFNSFTELKKLKSKVLQGQSQQRGVIFRDKNLEFFRLKW